MAVTRRDRGNRYVVAEFFASGEVQLNTSTSENAANAAGGETVSSMNIVEAFWSTGNGAYFTVQRGANVIAQFTGSGFHDYQGNGLQIDNEGGNPESNTVVTKTGAGPSMLILKYHKTVTGITDN